MSHGTGMFSGPGQPIEAVTVSESDSKFKF